MWKTILESLKCIGDAESLSTHYKANGHLEWMKSDPWHEQISSRDTPLLAIEIGMLNYGEVTIRSTFKFLGYERRALKLKWVSTDLHRIQVGYALTLVAKEWTRKILIWAGIFRRTVSIRRCFYPQFRHN